MEIPQEEQCPHCLADLRGNPIPQEYIDAGYYGTHTHYSRKIGVDLMGVYDGVLYWMCPDCSKAWHRWSEDTAPDLHRKAEPYINQRNNKLVG